MVSRSVLASRGRPASSTGTRVRAASRSAAEPSGAEVTAGMGGSCGRADASAAGWASSMAFSGWAMGGTAGRRRGAGAPAPRRRACPRPAASPRGGADRGPGGSGGGGARAPGGAGAAGCYGDEGFPARTFGPPTCGPATGMLLEASLRGCRRARARHRPRCSRRRVWVDSTAGRADKVAALVPHHVGRDLVRSDRYSSVPNLVGGKLDAGLGGPAVGRDCGGGHSLQKPC